MMVETLDRLFTGLRIASSGLTAERVRMDVIAENIANARTTRMPEGGPYRRKIVRFEPILRRTQSGPSQTIGVRAVDVIADYETPTVLIHDPSHPDRDEYGFVEMPNVNSVLEMADLITAMRAYEANLSVQQNFLRMAERALELAR